MEIENPIGCIVTDLILPGISGLELFQRTRVLGWTMPTIIFTAFGDVGSVVRAFRCGIFHYLEKPFSSEKLIQSVKECLASCEKTHEMEKGRKDALLLLSRLTRKEREVLDLLVRGKSMKEICTEFATSFQSVSALRKRMLTKLDIGGDVLLAQWMRKHNLD